MSLPCKSLIIGVCERSMLACFVLHNFCTWRTSFRILFYHLSVKTHVAFQEKEPYPYFSSLQKLQRLWMRFCGFILLPLSQRSEYSLGNLRFETFNSIIKRRNFSSNRNRNIISWMIACAVRRIDIWIEKCHGCRNKWWG